MCCRAKQEGQFRELIFKNLVTPEESSSGSFIPISGELKPSSPSNDLPACRVQKGQRSRASGALKSGVFSGLIWVFFPTAFFFPSLSCILSPGILLFHHLHAHASTFTYFMSPSVRGENGRAFKRKSVVHAKSEGAKEKSVPCWKKGLDFYFELDYEAPIVFVVSRIQTRLLISHRIPYLQRLPVTAGKWKISLA